MTRTETPEIHSLPTDPDFYPSSDGKPMAETDLHRNLMTDFIQMLDDYFQDRLDVYVSGNLLLYYEEGNARKSVALDVFVVFGVNRKTRRTYLLWQEGKGPDFVLELSSKSTYRADLNRKKRLYAHVLGVQEYFIYDPDHQYLNPALQGYRLVDNIYEPILPADGRLSSNVLDLELGFKPNGKLGLYNPETGNWQLLRKERAEKAEAELAQLRVEIERLKAQ